MSYNWDDYAEISFGESEVSYTVGTNALDADPDLTEEYPVLSKNPDTGKPGFTAHSSLFYATKDCYVRFNGSRRIQHLLMAGIFYKFNRKIHTIYVVQVDTPGTLYCWFEG